MADDADRVRSTRYDLPGIRDRNGRAVSARLTGRSERHDPGRAAGVAAAATDGLGENAIRGLTERRYDAGRGDIGIAAVAAGAAAAAAGIEQAKTAASVAAGAADAIRGDANVVIPGGENRRASGRIDLGLPGLAGNIAGAAAKKRSRPRRRCRRCRPG